MPSTSFVTVDVFTNQRFAGNPLAVFTDARGIDDAAMQKIAVEFNYSEITFVLPPENPENSARIRIFTPTSEIGFAGHPNVGTAFVLGQQESLFGKPVGDKFRFEEGAGLVEVSLTRSGDKVTGATIRAPRPLETGPDIPVLVVANCAGLSPEAFRTAHHAPTSVSVGLAFIIAELNDLEALAAARPATDAFQFAQDHHARADNSFSLLLYVRDPENPDRLRTRVFAPLDNVPEDPATGSASAALAAYIVERGDYADGTHVIDIVQGVEMRRPSQIALAVRKANGKAEEVFISGESVPVISGTLNF